MLYTTKIISKIFITLAVFITAINFISCKEDPTSTNPPNNNSIDTVELYDWKIDTLGGFNFYSLYAADSENIFISSNPPVRYDGENFNILDLNDPTFSVGGAIHGFDKNNVYIGGGRVNSPYGPAEFKKIEGNKVTGYVIPGDSGVNIGDFLVENSNQSWIGTSEWRWVYYFNNGSYTKYDLDSGVKVGVFFKSPNNDIYVLGYKSTGNPSLVLNFTYRFINNSYSRIIVDTIDNESEMRINAVRCGKDIIREGKTSLFYFNFLTDTWDLLCNTASFSPNGWGGSSKERIIALGYANDTKYHVYVYENNKWTIEPKAIIPKYYSIVFSQIRELGDRVYIMINDYPGISYLLTGIRKKY